MSGRGRTTRQSGAAGQSSNPPPEGVFMTTDQIMELVRNFQSQPQTQSPAPVADTPRKSAFARLCSDFTHLGGKPFSGSETTLEVQAWIRVCERIFTRMVISDHDRVLIASSQLQSRALDWYELLISEIDEATLSWDLFRERFLLKFVPESEKISLARQFIDLRQGKSSVSDYVSSFEALSKYGLEFISTPYKKNLKFVEGLKKYLKKQLMLQLGLSFEKLVDSALHLEAVEKERDSDDDVEVPKHPSKKRSSDESNPSSAQKKVISSGSGLVSQLQSQRSGTPFIRKCFNCGSLDHVIKECTKPLFCRYCKKEGHHISGCPTVPNRPGKRNTASAPASSS